MKIKRIEIIGFKSFVDKVTLDFPQGITAIVGPNGCGKSNVVDAIRWVMGEQSAKNLRGRSMEDVIFGGSETRKPLGMAEVSLTFSTEEQSVPAKYLNCNEIQVTRRLYRDGESEYFLNKTMCRLMDIAELFMDTGVGARAYSIIEQGRIGMILLSKPEERRFLIEEAAGVTKFKVRKQVALKKIEVSRQNLLRIGDIIAELKRQLNALQRQAKKAEKFRAYREELKEIEISFAAVDYFSLNAEKEKIAGELAALDTKISTLLLELECGELALEEKRITFLEREKGLSGAQEEIYRGKAEIQAAESRLEFQKKEAENFKRQKERLTVDLNTLQRQLGEAEAEFKDLDDCKGSFATEMAGEEEALAARESVLAELTHAEQGFAVRLEESRRELFGLLSEIAQMNNRQADSSKRLLAIDERLARNKREKLLLDEKLADAATRSSALKELLLALVKQKNVIVETQAVLSGSESSLNEALEGSECQLQKLRNELSMKRSRLHSLQELESQFAGYGQGVRSLFLAEQFNGRFSGVVADVIESDELYEQALEAVLAEKLQYVICPGDSEALAAVDYLKKIAGGRCSLISKGLMAPSSQTVAEGEKLLERISVRDGCQELLNVLLGDTYIAEDLMVALAMARRYPQLTFVTLAGDVVSSGVVSGGFADGAQPGLVHKKREIKELTHEVAGLTLTVRQHEQGRERLKREISAAGEELRILRQKLYETELQLVNCDKDLLRVREEIQGVEERLALNVIEDDQLLEERAALLDELETLGQQKTANETRKTLLEADNAQQQETLAVQRRQIDELRGIVTDMKVRAASLKEKRESTLKGMVRLEGVINDVQSRMGGHRQELEKCDKECLHHTAAIADNEEDLRHLMVKQQGVEASFAALKAHNDGELLLVQAQEGQLKAVRANLEMIRQAVAERNVGHSELAIKLQNLENTLMDKHRLTTSALLSGHHAANVNEDASRLRQVDLLRLIDEMGEVNLTAIEECRGLDERCTFLSAQQADLEESLHSLQKAIQRINRTTRKRFLETFHLVNAKFQEVFPRLFCGGSADLRLTNEDDPLETGIDIIVQPPGKKLQNVALLSGGEKALTAVALIFSIFLIKPSPFCLLDEVDAPLDDANIGRFNEIVREMTAFSQFIIITHNKATMAVADTLFGITMEDPGVSKLVSVRLN